MTLARANLKAATVDDPVKALEKLRRNQYDMAILDINLPGMTGIALCERMRTLPNHDKTPVIFITSYSEFEPMARSVLKTGDDLIGNMHISSSAAFVCPAAAAAFPVAAFSCFDEAYTSPTAVMTNRTINTKINTLRLDFSIFVPLSFVRFLYN